MARNREAMRLNLTSVPNPTHWQTAKGVVYPKHQNQPANSTEEKVDKPYQKQRFYRVQQVESNSSTASKALNAYHQASLGIEGSVNRDNDLAGVDLYI